MADGGQQRGPDPVALGHPAGLLGLADQPLTVQDHRRLGREGAEDPAVLGGQHPSGQGQRHVVPDGHVHIGVLGAGDGVRADAAGRFPRLHVVRPLQQGHGLHGEGLAHPLQQRVQRRLPAQHAAGQEGENLGFGAQPGRLVGAPGGQVHHRGHGDGDAEEDGDGDHVPGVGDGEPVQRRSEVVVQQQRADGGGGEGRPEPAEQRRRHRERQEEQHVVGEAGVRGDVREQQAQQQREDHPHHPAGEDPVGPEPGGRADHGQTAPLGDLLVRDDVHVEVGPRVAGHARADAGAEHVLPRAAAAGAEHDLGGVDSACEGEQRLGDVVADHMVKRSSQVFDQGALDRELLRRGRGQAVAAGDVDGQDLAARALGRHPRGAPDERAPLRPAGEPDDDPLPRLPGRTDVVLAAVLLEVLVRPVGHPQQRELAQGGEVARPEVVGQGRVDLLGLVYVPVRHPPAQRLRGHVDQLDLVGPADHLVRHGLPLPHPGDRLDHVPERLQVLDVHRGHDVDAGPQQLLHVLPALGVARAGHVGVRELVHERDRGPAGEERVHVHLGEGGCAVRQGLALHLFEAVEHDLRARPPVVLDEADDAVCAPLHPAMALGEHRVGLAHTGCRAEIDPELAASHVPHSPGRPRRARTDPRPAADL